MGQLLEFEDVRNGHWHCGGDYPKVFVTRVFNDSLGFDADVWVSNINIDFDGASNAYGPNNKGEDNLANAFNATQGWFGCASYSEQERDRINAQLQKSGSPRRIKLDTSKAMGLMTALQGRDWYEGGKKHHLEPQLRFPVVQQAINGDPRPGFYVSATARPKGPEYLQGSHVDSAEVPFGALSGLLKKTGHFDLGDFGLGVRLDSDKSSGFTYLDSGGAESNAVGECSYKVFSELGGVGHNNNFTTGFIVFPGSRRADGEAKVGIADQLRKLSMVDNADELVRLIAYCGQVGKGRSGLEAWKQVQALPGDKRVKVSRPTNYLNVLNGLRTWGYPGYPTM
jgi:hypothetical protein